MLRAWLLVLVLPGCAGPAPVLRNVPRPNTAVAAGAAAAVAGAATLADPDFAARSAEANKVDHKKKPQQVKATVPADVLDRLDEKQAREPLVPDR